MKTHFLSFFLCLITLSLAGQSNWDYQVQVEFFGGQTYPFNCKVLNEPDPRTEYSTLGYGVNLVASSDLTTWELVDHLTLSTLEAAHALPYVDWGPSQFVRMDAAQGDPLPIENFRALPGNGEVLLAWEPIHRSTALIVQRFAGNQKDLLDAEELELVGEEIRGTSFRDIVIPNRIYTYSASTWNDDKISLDSVELEVVVPPLAPQNFTASTTPTSVTLTWNHSDPGGLTHYLIYKSVTGGALTEVARLSPNEGSWSESSIAPGTQYTYVAMACSSLGCSQGASLVTQTDCPGLQPVQQVSLTLESADSATLRWVNSQTSALHHLIFRSIDGAAPVQVGTSASTATSFFFSDLRPGYTYGFFVKSIGMCGLQVDSSTVTGQPKLATPTNLSPRHGATRVPRPVTFTWSSVPYADHYRLQLRFVPDSGSPDLIRDFANASSPLTSEATGPGRTYEWRLRALSAKDDVGASDWTGWHRFSTRTTN